MPVSYQQPLHVAVSMPRKGCLASASEDFLRIAPGTFGTSVVPRPPSRDGPEATKAAPGAAFGSSGGGIRTRDLRVMSPTSYLTAPPRGGLVRLVKPCVSVNASELAGRPGEYPLRVVQRFRGNA